MLLSVFTVKNTFSTLCIFYFGYLRYIGLYGGGKSHGNTKPLSHFSHRRMQILPLFAPEVGSDLRIMRKYGEKSGKLANFFQNN